MSSRNWRGRLSLKDDCKVIEGPYGLLEVIRGDRSIVIEVPADERSQYLTMNPVAISKLAIHLLDSGLVRYQPMSFWDHTKNWFTAPAYPKEGIFPYVTKHGDLDQLNIQGILKNAEIRGTRSYDPLAILFQLLPFSYQDRAQGFYHHASELEKQSHDQFKQLSVYYLSQAYYIKSHILPSLAPALRWKRIRERLHHFIKESENRESLAYHQFIKAQARGEQAYRPLYETTQLMETLFRTAVDHPFSFTLGMCLFDQGQCLGDHPLAQSMKRYVVGDDRRTAYGTSQQRYRHPTIELVADMGPIPQQAAINGVLSFFCFIAGFESIYAQLRRELNRLAGNDARTLG
ncbi:hypothetical protein [Pseudobacteriovorax antillogorgiicola]|uniref:Uncharacterized protein n=1 Tax=Pseudobacteriovorax antillogorgiicola TaxID=1513793 RepID=A0A1Y6BBZ4_9BACT|nr:hypothetical protein [Pseudobacteriovorax antillogorgiicola]TCS57385.1 hypothetical protein EDD56_103125 [Pseudobacteriovorax antillogorgiicola]SMF01773.1 hypothetical protein SAMN06296036_103208 [Pseudobacteriovorax antillogorgiicola]